MKLNTCTNCGGPRRSLSETICSRCRKHPKDTCPECGQPKGVAQARCKPCQARRANATHAAKHPRQPTRSETLASGPAPTDDGDWRAVPTYEGLYEACADGRIRRLPGWIVSKANRRRFFPGGIVKPLVDGTGYLTVNLHRNGQRTHVSVHILVMWAFTGIRSTRGKPINHIDGNKRNPALSNLEFTTPSGNTRHAFSTGLQTAKHGERAYGAKLTSEQVTAIRALKGAMSQRRIAALFGVTHAHIGAILKGERRVHG